jgi:hypothetical protein
LHHIELVKLINKRFTPSELTRYKKRVADWCEAYQSRGWPKDTPGFALQHYADLLAEIDDRDALVRLPTASWMRRHRAAALSLSGFARDLATAASAAAAEGRVADEARLLLGLASIAEVATNAAPTAVGVLASRGRVDLARAQAGLIPNPFVRVDAYRRIGKALRLEADEEGASAALGMALRSVEEVGEYWFEIEDSVREVAWELGRMQAWDDLLSLRAVLNRERVGNSTVDALVAGAYVLGGRRREARELVETADVDVGFALETWCTVADLDQESAQILGRKALVAEGEQVGPSSVARLANSLAKYGDEKLSSSLGQHALTLIEDHSGSELADIVEELRAPTLRLLAEEIAQHVTQPNGDSAFGLLGPLQASAALGDKHKVEEVERYSTRFAISSWVDCRFWEHLAPAWARLNVPERARRAAFLIPPEFPSARATALRRVAEELGRKGDFDGAIAAAADVPTPAERSAALADTAERLLDAGHGNDAEELALRSILEAQELEPNGHELGALAAIGAALVANGDHDRGGKVVNEALRLLGSVPAGRRIEGRLWPMPRTLIELGRLDAASRWLPRSPSSTGLIESAWEPCIARLGTAHVRSGNSPAAIELAEEILAELPTLQGEARCMALVAAAEIIDATGDSDRADLLWSEAYAAGECAGHFRRRCLAAMAQGLQRSDRTKRAQEVAVEADIGSDPWGDDGVVAHALADVGLDKRADARARGVIEAHTSATELFAPPRELRHAILALTPETAALELPRAFASFEERLHPEALPNMLATLGAGWQAAGFPREGLACALEAMRAARDSRDAFMHVIEYGAAALAADGPDTLWNIYESILEVDGWWPRRGVAGAVMGPAHR